MMREVELPVEISLPPQAELEISEDADFVGEKVFSETTIDEVVAAAPDAVVQKVKERLKVKENVEALMAEREEIIQQLEEAMKYFSVQEQENFAESVAERANFRGDWTALTKQRLEHPVGFVKYMLLKLKHLENLQSGTPNFLQKPTAFRQYVFDQIQHYEDVVDHVFGATEVLTSQEKGKTAGNLGLGKYGERPTVFVDAAHKDGTLLDEHQRHIIESHEAGHGIREFVGTEGAALRMLLDMEQIPSKDRNYLSNPDEVAERMSQLKNYFGLGPTENFTAQHLQYAREHYIHDTGLDNTMSQFFAGITPERETTFLQLINEFPI